MTRTHVFDSHVDTAKRWLDELRDELGLAGKDDAYALQALRAGLHAIRDRLTPHEVLDLGAQLPILIRGFYVEGWRLEHAPKRIRDRATMIASVRKELGGNHRLVPLDVLRAVVRLLDRHVSNGELDDIVATLPRPLASLWRELSGRALVAVPAAVTRRTNYSR